MGRPPQTVSPHQQQERQRQQKGFNDCATKAYRTFRKRYLETSAMAVVGGATFGFGLSIFGVGIPGAGASGGIGLRAAAHTAAKGATGAGAFAALDEAKLGGLAALAPSLLGGGLARHAISEAGRNENQLNAAVKDCECSEPLNETKS